MKSKLARIINWPELARAAGFKVTPLAKICGVSVPQIQRFFRHHAAVTPRDMLKRIQQGDVLALVREGILTPKEIASKTGYKQESHLSRDFKRHYGVPPGQWVDRGTARALSRPAAPPDAPAAPDWQI